jgi:hypothetical protein
MMYDDLPIKNGEFPVRNVKLPEGTTPNESSTGLGHVDHGGRHGAEDTHHTWGVKVGNVNRKKLGKMVKNLGKMEKIWGIKKTPFLVDFFRKYL